MVGKVPPADLRDVVFERLGAESDAVVQGPAYGEDAAALSLGDQLLVVSTDPISLAAAHVGTLGVHVACNDVAASGGDPEWLTVVVFVPDDQPELLDTVTSQLDAAARASGVAIVGGHSEYSTELTRPQLSLTAMGLAEEFVPTGGARPGDAIVLTKGAAIEGTAIMATDFRDRLSGVVGERTIDEAAGYFEELSVGDEARILREFATAMHDPTEGGVLDGLLELAVASGVTAVVDRDAVPIRGPTRALADALDVDPLATFGSGALLATVPEPAVDEALDACADAGIEAVRIGTVEPGPGSLVLDGTTYEEPVRDEMYRLWE
ncbi:AIR synthase family protein [Haloarculaceae archaeon H-GB1-1]|nr:AIR synthase family protein [Haloarculaceae archaeon H-GB1-1]